MLNLRKSVLLNSVRFSLFTTFVLSNKYNTKYGELFKKDFRNKKS